MSDPIREIEATKADSPTLWWLGHCGFAVKYQDIVFYVDPCRSTPEGRTRTLDAPLSEGIRARWLIPMHYGTFAGQSADASQFVDHMLGFPPLSRVQSF